MADSTVQRTLKTCAYQEIGSVTAMISQERYSPVLTKGDSSRLRERGFRPVLPAMPPPRKIASHASLPYLLTTLVYTYVHNFLSLHARPAGRPLSQ